MKRALRVLSIMLLVAAAAHGYTIDRVIGAFTFRGQTPGGFESGFIEFFPDHAFVIVRHLDTDHDTIADVRTVVRGEYYVSRKANGEPGIFVAPEGEAGSFLEEARGDGARVASFCLGERCFTRRAESAGYFDQTGNEPVATGSVAVTTDPPGAQVYVDGVPRAGRTPLTVRGLAAGVPVVLRIEHSGYLPLVHRFTPRADAEIQLALRLPTGRTSFVVRSIPFTNVRVDGRFVGRTPTEDLELPPGAHEVELVNDGARIRKVFTVEVREGEPYERMFRFFGRLSVDLGAPCRVLVGDVDLGEAPFSGKPIPAGVHRVRLVPEGGRPVTVSVRIETGVESRITGPPGDLVIDQPEE